MTHVTHSHVGYHIYGDTELHTKKFKHKDDFASYNKWFVSEHL
jgi:hypothetical protein